MKDGGPAGSESGPDGRAGAAAGTGGRSSASQDAALGAPCINSLGCVDQSGGRTVCDPVYKRCVECVSSNDCATNSECILSACVAFTPCVNSLTCPSGKVCDQALGHCVECASSSDCNPDFVCVNSFCLLACQSDRQCTPFSLLCDYAAGHCVECLRDTDCPAAEYCLVGPGLCVFDRCEQGKSRCQGVAVSRCSANGSALLPAEPCAPPLTCVETDAGASCQASP